MYSTTMSDQRENKSNTDPNVQGDNDRFYDTDVETTDDRAMLSKEESFPPRNAEVEVKPSKPEEDGPVVTYEDNVHLDIDIGDNDPQSRDWWFTQSSIEKQLQGMKPKEAANVLRTRKGNDGLYRAMQMNIKPSIIEELAFDSNWKLLTYTDRTATRKDENVMHAAVLSNDIKKIHILYDVLRQEKYEGIRRDLLDSPAHSRDRKGTVMEGEFALSVAALKLNTQTVDYLLKLGADVYLQNTRGDNIIHSLIGYAVMMPEKIVEIRDMIGFIYKFVADTKNHLNVKKLFTMVNNDQLTPLQLAVLKNVSELCTYLLSLKNVYLRGGRKGIYERKIYDITYLDSLTNREAHRDKQRGIDLAPPTDSVVEMIFANNTDIDTALFVVKHEIIAYIIQLKWRSYFPLFLAWAICHFVAMIILTAYSIVRVDVFFLNDSRNVPVELIGETENDFVVVAYWLILVFGFIFSIPIALFIYSRTIAKPKALQNSLHNIDYFVMYLIFVISIFVDSVYLGGGSSNYNGEVLLFSLLGGWLFSTIFLRAITKCGQLTFLVRRVIVRDILGFLLVFLFLLVAFATCLHDLMKYKIDENGRHVPIQNFETFDRTMYTMFHAMLGLSDIDEVFDARSSWLAVSLLITFLIITYALLVNALTGIITSTSEEIFAHKSGYMSVHRLSVLIFMEECFLLHRFKNPIGIESTTEDEMAFKLEIKSVSNIMTEEDKVISKEKEENLRLRNVVHDALHVSETVVYGYKCVDCKRREMILAANENAEDFKIIQSFKLDSDGTPVGITLNH